MSIATTTGDSGQPALTGGTRVSKADLRVEAYGTVDELNACLGFARSICSDENLRTRTEAIQRTLFRVGSALSRSPDDTRTPSALRPSDVDSLTSQVNEIEAIEGASRVGSFRDRPYCVSPCRALHSTFGRVRRSCPA